MGHGGFIGSDNGVWTKDENEDGFADYNEMFFNWEVPNNDARLVVYNACQTCEGNLCEDTVDEGADCVIGWNDIITIGDEKCFGETLFEYIDDYGYSVSYSAYLASNDCGVYDILIREGNCYINL